MTLKRLVRRLNAAEGGKMNLAGEEISENVHK